MKLELTLEASVGPDASVLIAVAAILQQPYPIPSAFVWSVVPETSEARIWITFEREVPALAMFVSKVQAIPGVKRVLLVGPLHSVVLAGPISPALHKA